jgi:hypothetical protein
VAIGSGLTGSVQSLAVAADGSLLVGGFVSLTPGGPSIGIARWDGGSWSSLGTGLGRGTLSCGVYAIRALPNGDIFVGGQFDTAGGMAVKNVAKWNGAAWSAVGEGLYGTFGSTAAVRALAFDSSGALIASGSFDRTGTDVVALNIARWNGTSWSSTDSTFATAPIYALENMPNGDVLAGGGMSGSLWRWNGSTWTAFAPGRSDVRCIRVSADGSVTVGAQLKASTWNGAAWVNATASFQSGWVYTVLILPNGDIVGGGDFLQTGSLVLWKVGRYRAGIGWSSLGGGTNAPANHLAVLNNGDLVAAGDFTQIGVLSKTGVSLRSGVTWSNVANGPSGASVYRMLGRRAGGLVVCTSNTSLSSLLFWNGLNWSPLGDGITGVASGVVEDSHDNLFVTGNISMVGNVPVANIARWDGVAWSSLGSGLAGSSGGPMVVMPNDDLIVSGTFTSAGGVPAARIARWNGSAWSALGAGFPSGGVQTLAALPNGDVIAGGDFTSAGGVPASRIARWNGTTWSALGTGVNSTVFTLCAMPNGDLLAGGWFTVAGGQPAKYLARWNGSTWSQFAGGTANVVKEIVKAKNNDIVIAGGFTSAGGRPFSFIAQWTDRAECDGDFNCSGTLEVADIFDYLAAWFAGDPATDLNGDGLSVQDIFRYLNAWFAGC